MLKKFKHILQTYTDKELEEMDFWVNSEVVVEEIIVSKDNINLITDNSEVIINGFIDKEPYK